MGKEDLSCNERDHHHIHRYHNSLPRLKYDCQRRLRQFFNVHFASKGFLICFKFTWVHRHKAFLSLRMFSSLRIFSTLSFLLFSSPELKVQVSFSDRLLSFVHCPSVCPSVKNYIFTSSPEPLRQFQPNMAQSILGCTGFKFIQMKGHAHFQAEIITKQQKYIDEI